MLYWLLGVHKMLITEVLAAVKSEVSQRDFFLLVPCHMHMGPKADQEMHMHTLYSTCTVCTSIVLWL